MTDAHQHPAPAAPTVAGDPTDPFVHLHTHTEYSLLDGAARIGELVDTAKRMGQPAVAITDHGVLYGAVEFTTAARKAGIQPIIGCEMYMAPRSRHDKEGKADRDPNHLVLIARDLTGYRNLVRMVSRSHLEGHYYKPRIDKELLAEHAEGLTCLSACIGGELPQAILRGDMDAAESVARQHMEILGPDNYLLELQDHGIPEEVEIRAGLLEIARRTGLPLVCTNDSHYIRSEDSEAHDILLCLQTGARRQEEKRFRFHGPHFYMADGDEMRERFAAYGEAASNTLEVARRCNLELPMGKTLLPRYQPIPEGLDADSYLRELCEQGLRERYPEPTREAHERLAMELDVIRETGFAAYFLIVWDFIRAARCDGVKVGPGRGSAAGSLVAYVLRITNICPLRYGLIFERFLNRERVSMPDIDIDFDDRRRDRVIQYVQEKYGRDRVAQIITFGTMAARAAIRDVGRVLDVPLGDVDRLAKLVPAQVGITLEKALENRELREVYDNEPWAKTVIDNARRLEGICRNASTHAAGVVIAPEPLEDIVPLQRSTNDRDAMVTQFDMNGVQTIGLLKMDFLGLTNLSVIEAAVDNVRRTTGVELDIDNLPLDDPATYALLGRADTLGVFQMDAVGGKKILLDMQPQTLDDISAASALNRPGPIEGGVIDIYMKRKRGEEAVEYLLPELEPILADTNGVIVYQEQVMKIASAVAGYTLGEADILRAAMGKKDKAKMALQREKFLAGASSRGVDPSKAEELFDLMAFFAGYGFNRCISGDSIVWDSVTGERRTVRSLYRDRRPVSVHSLGEDGRLRSRPVTDVIFNGMKAVYEVRTEQGRRIRATSTHRFKVFDGWKRLSELRVGDALATVGDGAAERFLERIGPHCLGRENVIRALGDDLAAIDERASWNDTVPSEVIQSNTASSDILWDRIVAIEPAGVEDTYDLTVETDHNFVADGFIVHNSHSISYSIITYQTAYLKANHPLEYMTALLNSKAGDFDKLKMTILDSHARGLVVRPPDINRSGTGFVVGDSDKREILYGLSHIKNVGEKVVENLLVARDEGGPFASLLDLCLRAGGRDLNRRVLEALVRSGACDGLGDRATLLAVIDRAMDRAAQVRREREQGQTSLFGLPSDGNGDGDGPAPLPVEDLTPVGVVPAPEEDRLRWERELLGMYLSDHPLRRIADTLRSRVDTSIGELGPHLDGLVVQIGGAVREVRTVVPRRSATGQRMAFLQIEDMSGSCEVVVFARTFEECASLLHADSVVVVRGKVEAQSRGEDEDRGGEPEPAKIIAEAVFGLEDPRLLTWRRNATVHITLGAQHVPLLGALREALEHHPGDNAVVVHVEQPHKVDQVSLAEGAGVDPGPALERAVCALLGEGAYRLELRRERAAPRDARRGARPRNGGAPPA